MKAVDLKSALVAGVIGAVVLALISNFTQVQTQSSSSTGAGSWVLSGFLTGVAVQIGLRLSGVS